MVLRFERTSPSTNVLLGSAYDYAICTINAALRRVSQLPTVENKCKEYADALKLHFGYDFFGEGE